jgi:phosphoglycerol transferase MdoB-like AlkP superfamily enzyme
MTLQQRTIALLKKFIPVAIVFTVLAILPIVMQYLHILDKKEVQHWLEVFGGPYRVNRTIIIFLFLCFYAAFNSIFFALSATVVFCLTFSVVDMQKMRILDQPLLPGDLFFLKQALLIVEMYISQAIAGCIAIIACITGTFFIRRKLPHYGLPVVPRVILAVLLATTAYFSITRFDALIDATNKKYAIVNEFWDQLSNYQKNGVLYGFLLNIKSSKVEKPPHYTQKSINRIFFYDSTTVTLPTPHARSPHPPAPNPDVIIYMNESFWDITQIKSIKPARDPVPTYHALGKRNRKTALISPTFGGNTCLAEFEILTGMSNSFFPPGSIAYNQFITRPVPSAVRLFKENGYSTLALHSFKRWFWNRHNVYRYFGFDEFISDDSMSQEPLRGTYISDEALARRIVTQAAGSKGPKFIFALSMQNHGHYGYKRYDTLDCPVATGLSNTADLEYNTYLQGLIDADKSLKIVSSYVKKAKKPTLLIFFGDHLPGFTNVYEETGLEKRFGSEPLLRYRTTAVWQANFPLPPMNDSIISMIYLPLLLAKQAGLKLSDYYRLLDNVRAEYPIYTGTKRLTPDGRTIAPTAATRVQDNALRMLLYDSFFGKNYASRYFHPEPPPTP